MNMPQLKTKAIILFYRTITTNIIKLQKMNNIHFLDKNLIPNCLLFQKPVATIPFVIDGVTLKASPIKFYEYLASIALFQLIYQILKIFQKLHH